MAARLALHRLPSLAHNQRQQEQGGNGVCPTHPPSGIDDQAHQRNQGQITTDCGLGASALNAALAVAAESCRFCFASQGMTTAARMSNMLFRCRWQLMSERPSAVSREMLDSLQNTEIVLNTAKL
jgi:hypothetical protein